MRFFGSHILCNAGDDLYRLGRWDESEQALRRAEEVNPLGINAILVEELLGRLAMARGRFDEAQERLAPLAQAAERAADIQFIIPVHASLAELALWQGKPDEAVAHVMAADPADRVLTGGPHRRGLCHRPQGERRRRRGRACSPVA